MKEYFRQIMIFIFIILSLINGLVGFENLNITETATKSYEEEEEGKIMPFRTFLETWEIVVICVCFVLLVFLIILPCIYVCNYGWVLPKCCRRKRETYSQIEQHREHKTNEIWKQSYRAWDPAPLPQRTAGPRPSWRTVDPTYTNNWLKSS